MWQIINNNVQFSYKEFNYDLTAIYENHGHINYDKYDKQLSSRLPMFGSRQGDIRFELSNLKMTDRSDSAKSLFTQLLKNKIMEVEAWDYSCKCSDTLNNFKGIKDIEEIQDCRDFGTQRDYYTLEFYSANFFKTAYFKSTEGLPLICINTSPGLLHADRIIKILKQK